MQSEPATRNNRFLVIVRASDNSLHPSWLDPSGGPRNWDLHISHFGGLPLPDALPPGVVWTNSERKPKWPGIADVVASRSWALDDYDYIAIADDDLIVESGAWSRAFDTAREQNLPVCQLSLLHGSFFGEISTLRLPGLLLHRVARVEQMAIVVRADVFQKLVPFMGLPGNLWAMDHVLAHLTGVEASNIAVLDNASALHTRRFWSGAAYDHYRDRKQSALDEERAFLAAHGIPWLEQHIRDGLSLGGKPVPNIWWKNLAVLPARALRKYREMTRIARIAVGEGDSIWLLRRFASVRLGRVDAEKVGAAA